MKIGLPLAYCTKRRIIRQLVSDAIYTSEILYLFSYLYT